MSPERIPFEDRRAAGRALARELLSMSLRRPAVYALPRGGVPVAFECALALKAPLDLMLVRKIGAPGQPELAVGAVADAGGREVSVRNDRVAALTGADESYFARELAREREELKRRGLAYFSGRERTDPAGRDAVLVDDGLATGATARAGAAALREMGAATVVVAVPVAPPETAESLTAEADEVVCLLTPEAFSSVGQWYLDFHQLEDREVTDLLDEARRLVPDPNVKPSA